MLRVLSPLSTHMLIDAHPLYELSDYIFSDYFPLYQGRKTSVKKELKDGFLVYELDVPGVKKQDLSIEVSDRAMYIKAERSDSKHKYSTKIALPESVDVEKSTAKLEDGVLRIEMPLKQEKHTIKIV